MPYDTYVTADSGDFTADQTNPVTYVTADSTDFTSDQINHDTYVTADSTDFTSDSIDPNPTPTVQIVVANPEYFNPVVEWSNGKARIVNTASFNSGGKNIYYFIGGQPYVANLPTSYVFSPGDSVSIIMAIGTSPDSPYNSHWSQKAYAQIIFGPEPTPSDPAIPVGYGNSYKVFRPSWLYPTDIWMARGMAEAPYFTLIDGKIFSAVRKRTDITSASLIKLINGVNQGQGRGGVQAVMDTAVDNQIKTNWTESKFFVGKTNAISASDISDSDIHNASNAQSVSRFEADELQEGDPYGMLYARHQYLKWYQERADKYASEGATFRDFGTYGGSDNYNGNPWNNHIPGGGNNKPNDPFFKGIIANPKAPSFTSEDTGTKNIPYFSLGGLESIGVGAIIKHYADQADYASRYYNKAFAAEVMAKGMNMTIHHTDANATSSQPPPPKLVYLDWGKIEGLPEKQEPQNGNNFLHEGMYYSRQVGNLGVLKTNQHPQVDYDWEVANIFCIGFCRTNGYIVFDNREPINQFGTDSSKVKKRSTDSQVPVSDWQWIPTIPGTPEPTTAQDDGYPTEPIRWHDAGYEAAYFYQQCFRTEGLPWQYCRYKFKDSDVWVEPNTDGTTILEHASAFGGPYGDGNPRRGRPDAMCRVRHISNVQHVITQIDVWAFDPSRGKDSYETIILNPFQEYMIEVNLQGSKLALFSLDDSVDLGTEPNPTTT